MRLDEIEQRLSDSVHEFRDEAGRKGRQSAVYAGAAAARQERVYDRFAAPLLFKGTNFARTDIISTLN
jgi:hypothetical protein